MKSQSGAQRLRDRSAAPMPGPFWPASPGEPAQRLQSRTVAPGGESRASAGMKGFANDPTFRRLQSELQRAQDMLESCLRQRAAPSDPLAWRLRVKDLQRTVCDRYGAVREYLRMLREGVQEI